MRVDSGLTPPISPIVFIKHPPAFASLFSTSGGARPSNELTDWFRDNVLFCWCSPLHPLQVENKDSVQHGHQQQRNHRRHAETADLSVTKRLPQRPAMRRQREESNNSRAHRDQYRTQTNDAGIEERFAQTLSTFVGFFNEVEQHNDVADDHSN